MIGIPHGRVLGGSSALNAQAFIAPSEVGIDMWETLGNPGWNWKTISAYYKKSYSVSIPTDDIVSFLGLEYLNGSKDTGANGPIQTSYTADTNDVLGKAWIETFKNMNYNLTSDPFSGSATGGFANPTTVNGTTKERSYAASAYYQPVMDRSNLDLITNSHVEKIIFETVNGSKMATGVQFTQGGTQKVVVLSANKEVIVAAGAFNSPKLLELSGIGGATLLNSMKIPVVIDNPNVGENFQDHPMSGISFEVHDGVTTLDPLSRQEPEALQAAMIAYQTEKRGPFSGGAVNSFAFMPIVDFQSPEGKPEMERVLDSYAPTSPSAEYDFLRSIYSSSDKSSASYFMYAAHGNFGADSSAAKNVTQTTETGNFITVVCELSYPLSRGSVHIASAAAGDKPVIDAGYYKKDLDLEMHARHVRFIEKIISTEPLASFLKTGGKRSPSFATIGSDLEAAKGYIQRTMISGWHPCGTCAMLPKDKGGVVNERLVVHGTKNLRVVDASIMPLICRGNTQSTVYAVAERAADLIKEDHKLMQ